MPSCQKSAAYWRKLAADAHAVAERMSDPEAKREMLAIAERYAYLAERAEARRRGSAAKAAVNAEPEPSVTVGVENPWM